MLTELHVSNLGVIASADVVLGPGMTAFTGETGAGKTLLIEAIELLVGGRADGSLVRQGADEAWVEGRFVAGDTDEVVLARAIPRDGRSRAYVNGRLATVATLAEHGAALVDLHGQHAHQSLLATATQRAALDTFGRVDLTPLRQAIATIAEIDTAMATLGGDERSRAREIDLLRFQVRELDAAALADPDEDAALDREETLLADALAHRDAATRAVSTLVDDGGALDAARSALGALGSRPPFAALAGRLRALIDETDEVAAELRSIGEAIEDDPERLDDIRARRQLLRELRRKYGEQLSDVMDYHRQTAERLAELESYDARFEALKAKRAEAERARTAAAAAVGAARRAGAKLLGAAIVRNLAELALPKALIEVLVSDVDPGDDVTITFSANAGMAPLPLAKVASGGELARTMLALRLVLSEAPPTLVFDEVDAGVGGQAALAVGRSLAELGVQHQVFVVTHLAQVAAFADHQLAVEKRQSGRETVTVVHALDDDARVVELSRMLSGMASSESARVHAKELLASARAPRSVPTSASRKRRNR